MAVITKHGKRRMAERIGASAENAAQKNADRAFKKGIRHNETLGALHHWINGKYLNYRSAGDMRIYREYLYVFNHGILITVLNLPDEIKDSMEEYVLPEAFQRYRADLNERNGAKRVKNERKYMEKKERFHNLVMLNDVRQFAQGQYDVEFTGVHTLDGLLSICYIPNTRNIPTMQPVADYMRSCTKYPRVRLVHVKDLSGNRIYGNCRA